MCFNQYDNQQFLELTVREIIHPDQFRSPEKPNPEEEFDPGAGVGFEESHYRRELEKAVYSGNLEALGVFLGLNKSFYTDEIARNISNMLPAQMEGLREAIRDEWMTIGLENEKF